MPTIISHPAVVLALAAWWKRRLPAGLVAVAALCSIVPDADVAAFGFGIPYTHPFGHRGFTHSIMFAILFGAFAAFAYVRLARSELPLREVFLFLTLTIATHGLLDAMTNGGRGVGFFIPFNNERYFLPFRPIKVSPIGADDFLDRATPVLLSEITWVWLPCFAISALSRVRRPLSVPLPAARGEGGRRPGEGPWL